MVDPFLRPSNNENSNSNKVNQEDSVTNNQEDNKIQTTQRTSNQNTNKTSSNRTNSRPIPWRLFLWGCLGLIIFIVGLAGLVLFMILQNPDQYSNIGLDRTTIKILLQTFSVLFFGFLFFLGFGLFLVNGYKIITVKNKSKIIYAIVSMLGFIMSLGSIAVGVVVLNYIEDIDQRALDTSSLVIPYYMGPSGPTSLPDRIIAPAFLSFGLNTALYNRRVLPGLGNVIINDIVLNCGNNKTLSINSNTFLFDGTCDYRERGNYNVSVVIRYTDRQTNESRNISYNIGTLSVPSQISLRVEGGNVGRGNGELVLGRAPAKVYFDAGAVFRDFGLSEYRIVWDINGDGTVDAENVADVINIYNVPRVYNVAVNFPGLNNDRYSFPIRIEQPDVPICIVDLNQTSGTRYQIDVSLTGRTDSISSYSFSVLDISNNRRQIHNQTSDSNNIEYNFPGRGVYAVRVNFVTADGRQGSCESANTNIGQADFQVNYDLYFSLPEDRDFRQLNANTPIFLQGGDVVVSRLPVVLQLRISSIEPLSSTAQTSVFFNDTPLVSPDGRTYEARLNQTQGGRWKIVINDPSRGASSEEVINVIVKQDNIQGRLLVSPGVVGTEPFAVTLDASQTVLQDQEDEIVFFTWDFGNGDIFENTSQGVVTYTYSYDYENENGIFSPSVFIRTRKGASLNIVAADDIIVRKSVQDVRIRVDSHPTQIAGVGENVNFELELSGIPRSIVWDFGDGNTFECPERQCMNQSHTYENTGNYNVVATVNYDNLPSVKGSIVVRVQ